MPTTKEQITRLEAEVASLRGILMQLGAVDLPREDDLALEDRPDFIAHGSERHAMLLGLKKIDEHTPEEYAYEGMTLQDLTTPLLRSHGSKEYVKELLRQRVDSWMSGPPPAPQSVNPRAPHYAPAMWQPSPLDG